MTRTIPPVNPDNDGKPFEIRAYYKVELAQMYFPRHSDETALQNFYRWIRSCVPLMAELYESGYNKRRHWFFKQEVSIIRKHLGEP